MTSCPALPYDLLQESGCHRADLLPFPMPGNSLRATQALAFPSKVDGRAPLSLQVMSSGACLSDVPKNSTRGFHYAGKSFQKNGK